MKPRNKYRIIAFFIYAVIVFSFLQYYTITNAGLSKSTWKYSEGSSIGDLLRFKNAGYGTNHELNDDTILLRNEPTGFIVKRGYRLFGGNFLIVKNLKTGKTGRYCEQ